MTSHVVHGTLGASRASPHVSSDNPYDSNSLDMRVVRSSLLFLLHIQYRKNLDIHKQWISIQLILHMWNSMYKSM